VPCFCPISQPRSLLRDRPWLRFPHGSYFNNFVWQSVCLSLSIRRTCRTL
jgi:hypothetical protein